jgi:pyrimidine oxygenase
LVAIVSFGGYAHESFTLMAGLAVVTSRIKLFASVAVLTLPPAMVARMAVTIDSISLGRFGVNIVSGWAKDEYTQMGLWPGDEYFGYRYNYRAEYVQIMQALWANGQCDLDGEYFTMEDCRLLPKPQGKIELVAAGQSDTGMAFTAKYCDYQFVLGSGVNTPTAFAPTNERLMVAARATGRDIGSYVLLMVIADETDEAAMAKWQLYNDGADASALSWMADQGAGDPNASAGSTARSITAPEGVVNFNMGTIVGSYASVARMLDEAATVPGTKGLMLTFDDFVEGMENFGTRIQLLMCSRADRVVS